MQRIIELKIEETKAVVGGLAQVHRLSLTAELRAFVGHFLPLPMAERK